MYHRGYEVREPIEVRVLPDHLTITSYPGPDRSISLNEMGKGYLVARRYRNRRIGEFLKELRLTEGRGTGIPTVLQAMRDNGSPDPQFKTDEDRTHFTVILPKHPQATPQVTGHTGGLTEPKSDRERMNALLRFCVSPRDRASIQARLQLRDRKARRTGYLTPAIKDGWLAMTDPAHPTSPAQKYRTTESGRDRLQETGGELACENVSP